MKCRVIYSGFNVTQFIYGMNGQT